MQRIVASTFASLTESLHAGAEMPRAARKTARRVPRKVRACWALNCPSQ